MEANVGDYDDIMKSVFSTLIPKKRNKIYITRCCLYNIKEKN